jgi:hypothetical protein
MRSLTCLPLLAALACGGTQSTDVDEPDDVGEDGANPVRVHRPFQTGQRFGVVVDAHQILEVMVEGAEQEVAGLSEELRLHLEGEVTVHEVDDEGRAASATLEVQSFTDPESGGEIMPAGTTIVAERGEEGLAVGIPDGEISEDQGLLLDLAFPLQRPGSPLGDELFGTDTPRQAGDSWPIDAVFVAEDMNDDGFSVSETDVTGEVRLVDLHNCSVGRCMQLEAQVHATEAAIAELGDEAEFEEGQLDAVVRLEVPVDDTKPVLMEETMVTGSFVASFQVDGEAVQRQLAASRMRKAVYTPIP